MHVYAARQFGAALYGAFAVGFAIVLLCEMAHDAQVLEPLVVYGAVLSPSRFRRHLGIGLRQHVIAIGIGVVILFVAGFWLGHLSAESGLMWAIGMCTALSTRITMLFFRRGFQAVRRFDLALFGTVGYAVLLLTGCFVLGRAQQLTPTRIFLVMAAASAVVAAWQIVVLRPRIHFLDGDERLRVTKMTRYGAWALGGAAVRLAGTNAPYFLLPAFSTLAEVASFRAALNLYLPYQHLMVGISTVMLPGLSRTVAEDGHGGARKVMWRVMIGSVLPALAFGGLMSGFGSPIIRWLYAGRFGPDTVSVLRLGAALPLLWVAVFIPAAFLRANGRSDKIFRANLVAFLCVGIAAMLVGAHFGATGMIVALTVYLAATVVTTLLEAARAGRARSVGSA